jgi:phosphatidylserine/phosphatidylglycerophosphate/cardiolipin synthase-like enzyme
MSHRASSFVLATLVGACSLWACGTTKQAAPVSSESDFGESRGDVEVLLTDPFCDECSAEDKDVLSRRSAITRRVIELLDGAKRTVDIAQFTFSARDIEAAILRARDRGVRVRVAMDAAQDKEGTVSRRLKDAGIDLRFVRGAGGGGHDGIMHAKFMMVDGRTLLSGSNNWSSTGTSINEENTLVLTLPSEDPRIVGHQCQFEAIYASDLGAPAGCSNGSVAFAPSSAAQRLVRDGIREAKQSIDVLMHHLTAGDLVVELARAAERGVRVRVIVNAADRHEHAGRNWDRLFSAGGKIRYKRTNADQFQLMHHKLAVVDDRLLLTGSGNWSGSGFFKNFETYARYQDPRILQPFRGLYYRLWNWSLSAESLDAGTPASEQHARSSGVYFGNLHAHIHAREAGRMMDDGEPRRLDESGASLPVEIPEGVYAASRQAYEYARDRGKLDFVALSPHGQEDRPNDPVNEPNLTERGFEEMLRAAEEVTASSSAFVALPGMEWSTNSAGNHLGVYGMRKPTKVERGRFDTLYDEFLPSRAFAGDRPMVLLAHPRTFPTDPENLVGNWDQIFGVNLAEIARGGERAQKFNDFGLDDYPPLSEVRPRWLSGEEIPDEQIVKETLLNVSRAAAPFARMMEVTLNRGNELGSEIPQNPSLTEDLTDSSPMRRTKAHTDWDYYLLRGFRLAPVASHDNHMANWGTGHTSRTAIVAEGLDELRLLGAIEQRAVFASEDQNLAVRLYAEERTPMGGAMATRGAAVAAQLLLRDPDYDGPFEVKVYRGRVGGDEVSVAAELTASGGEWLRFDVALDAPGEHFFYVEVLEVGPDRMAWSAPIWVERL